MRSKGFKEHRALRERYLRQSGGPCVWRRSKVHGGAAVMPARNQCGRVSPEVRVQPAGMLTQGKDAGGPAELERINLWAGGRQTNCIPKGKYAQSPKAGRSPERLAVPSLAGRGQRASEGRPDRAAWGLAAPRGAPPLAGYGAPGCHNRQTRCDSGSRWAWCNCRSPGQGGTDGSAPRRADATVDDMG